MGKTSKTGVQSLDIEALEPIFDAAPVTLAVLYGSHARGDAGRASDVDLAIAFDESLSSVERTRTRLTLIDELSTRLGTDDVDIVPLSHASASLRRDLCADGVVIYGEQRAFDAYCADVDVEAADSRTHADRLSEFDDLLADLEQVV